MSDEKLSPNVLRDMLRKSLEDMVKPQPTPPPEPISPLVEGAIGMVEMFRSHVRAGFTEDQALKFLAYLFAAMAANQKPEG